MSLLTLSREISLKRCHYLAKLKNIDEIPHNVATTCTRHDYFVVPQKVTSTLMTIGDVLNNPTTLKKYIAIRIK